ncbi:MAG: Flp family type IVb pilin [Ardenticatenia bacterium]|nr:Flp family type IVb pilin [Ardenticatenia bacterium]
MFLRAYLYLQNLLRGEEGADLVEYALIIALVVVVCIAALAGLGTDVQAVLQRVRDALGL